MITCEYILSKPDRVYNYFELMDSYEGGCKDAFPQKYFPSTTTTTAGARFIQRSKRVHTEDLFEERLFVILNETGKLLPDSYAQYYEVPTYPCYLAMVVIDKRNSVSNPVKIGYVTDTRNVNLDMITSVEGKEFTIKNPDMFPSFFETLITEVSSRQFLSSI